jgi:hypothetical protein
MIFPNLPQFLIINSDLAVLSSDAPKYPTDILIIVEI